MLPSASSPPPSDPPSTTRTADPAGWIATLVLAAVLCGSLALNLRHNGFDLGFHSDERKKVAQIQHGGSDFRHPALLLAAVRTARLAIEAEYPDGVARLGRTVVAVLGTLAVLLTFVLARRLAGTRVALLAAALFAVSPSLVIHAHYIKEDVLFTATVLLALLACLRAAERPSAARMACLGAATGLAGSSKYLGALLFAVYVLLPLAAGWLRSDRAAARAWYRGLAIAVPAAAAVFLAVNFRLVIDPGHVAAGFSSELRHALTGHLVRVWPLEQWFTFHWRHSVVAGLTPPVAYGALAAAAWWLWRRPPLGTDGRILLLFAGLYYAAIELSPTKPFPDFMRYALPLLPLVALVAAAAAARLARAAGRHRGVALAALAAAALAYPLYDSVRLVAELENDTRTRAAAWLASRGDVRALFERHAALRFDRRTLASPSIERLQRRKAGVDYLVLSSFTYDRYAFADRLWGQRPRVHSLAAGYRRLFTCPYVEIAPAYRSFALSNPTIRIVDLHRCPLGTAADRPPEG